MPVIGACQVSSTEDSISAVELRNTLPCKVYDDLILLAAEELTCELEHDEYWVLLGRLIN